jgi:replication factor C subunit 2/4
MRERLEMIADAENFSDAEKSLIDEILLQSNGDMRRAVTTLQSVHSLADGSDNISPELIAEIAGIPPATVVTELWMAVSDVKSSFDGMNKAVNNVCAAGYSAQSLLGALLPNVVSSVGLSEVSKSKVAIRIAEAEKNMIEGADEYLQLMTVCSLMLSCFQQDVGKQ